MRANPHERKTADDRLPAREEGLLERSLLDGILLYDPVRHQAHSLNRLAALVWRHCDGQARLPELVQQLRQELDTAVDEGFVRLALDRLEKAHLLREPLPHPAAGSPPGVTRRTMLRQTGLAAGVSALLPVVTSLAVPPAAMAVSVTSADTRSQPTGGLPNTNAPNLGGTSNAPTVHLQ